MDINCAICDTPFADGEPILFLAATEFKRIPSKVAYAIKEDFRVVEMMHNECFFYEYGPRGGSVNG